MNNLFKQFILLTSCFSLAACVGKSAYYSSMYGSSNYNTSLYYAKNIDQQALAKFINENQPKPNMAKVIFFHSGEYSKYPESYIEYNDIQLEGQKKYRFKATEYVVYDVPTGAYDLLSWSACVEPGSAQAGEEVYPNQSGRASYQYSYSKLNSLLENKKLKFNAGNIYVYDFKTVCQQTIHRDKNKRSINLLTLTDLQNQSAQPLAIIYDKNRASKVVE